MLPSDLFLSPDLTEADARAYLASLGFSDPVTVDEQFQAMADDLAARQALGRIARELLPALCESPDPDAAVDGLARYLQGRTGRAMFLDYLGEDPRALHALAMIFGASPFLTEILLRNPEYFHWLVPQIERSAPDRQDLEDEADASIGGIHEPLEAFEVLKRWKRRELLRIAARDLQRRETVPAIAAQLSDLAIVIVTRVLDIVTQQALEASSRDRLPGAFAVIAMGKLGGHELNYSSDIDLMYVFDESGNAADRELFQRLARMLTVALSDPTAEGLLYRVDLRLRPGSERGAIARSIDEYARHYSSHGDTFERFALIKARPIAGDGDLGRRFMEAVHSFVYRPSHDAVSTSGLGKIPAKSAATPAKNEKNVKTGSGGIREVELFTQMYQLMNGGVQPALRQPNTLAALESLVSASLISEQLHRELAHAYEFLRSVEHRLQLVHDDQTHTLPASQRELDVTARRLGLQSSEDLEKQLAGYRARVSEIYRGLFEND